MLWRPRGMGWGHGGRLESEVSVYTQLIHFGCIAETNAAVKKLPSDLKRRELIVC